MNNLIQWPAAKYWDKAWNPMVGCRPCSPACEHCYANAISNRFKMGNFSEPRETLDQRFYNFYRICVLKKGEK